MQLDSVLPLYLRGRVVSGFGRGGKELGCPTANMEDAVVDSLPSDLPCGVFYGLARVEGKQIEHMVSSVGWNPHYRNERKTLEVHILQNYDKDFYGAMMEILIVGYIRPMEAYATLDDLRAAINSDITTAERELTRIDTSSFVQQFFCERN